jgi:hypothetical protein
VNPKRGRPEDAPSEYEAVKALLGLVEDAISPQIPTDGFRTDSASGRLALLALASLEPRDTDGAPLDLTVQFQTHGVAGVIELVPGHRAELGARGLWPAEASPPTGAEPAEILASHAIDSVAATCLLGKDIDGFVHHRNHVVAELAERFLARHVDSHAITRPSLTDLVVPDDDT